MPPDNTKENEMENFPEMDEKLKHLKGPQAVPMKHEIVYPNVLLFTYWHLGAIYGLYLCFTSAKHATILLGILWYFMAEIGVTAGAHRLWSHRSFKANTPLQIILMIFNSMSHHDTIFHWVRDHRLHHRYCDTDADPYNAARGFFFSHIGWLLTKKNIEVKERGKTLDMSDLTSNPVVMFQKKYALQVIGTTCFILPTVIPMYFWGETLTNAWYINVLRYTINLNASFCINSVAHLWGAKPYDKSILPVQSVFVSTIALGEGFHNYHHVFPWDYKAAEFGNNSCNITTLFIDFFSWIGWATELKSVSDDVIKARAQRTGDGSDLWGLYKEHKQEKQDN